MFKIPYVEKSSYYIDRAISKMEEFAIKERALIEERFKKSKSTKPKEMGADYINLNKRKDLELEKIRFLNISVNTSIKKIVKKFPKTNKLSDIYTKLLDTCEISSQKYEEYLSSLNKLIERFDDITQNTELKIKKAKTQQTLTFIMGKYLGKVNSLFKKRKTEFENLNIVRNFLNKLPEFLDLYTVCISGFPNVGKSTLMNRLSGSDVEIQNYPFTTKGIMFGYITKGNIREIQLIDTPGLLNRKKSNEIERRAQIIVTDFSDLIVFVLDFTESCGFDVESQVRLLKKTKQIDKKIIVYLSKTDIYDDESKEARDRNRNTLKKFEVFEDSKLLGDYILNAKIKNKKFDIRNIDII